MARNTSIFTHIATATCDSRRIRLITCAARGPLPSIRMLRTAVAHVAGASPEDIDYYRVLDSTVSLMRGCSTGFANLTPGLIMLDALAPRRAILLTLAHEVAHLTQPALDPASATASDPPPLFNPETLAEVLTPYLLAYHHFRRSLLAALPEVASARGASLRLRGSAK